MDVEEATGQARSRRIVRDVAELIIEIGEVTNTMLVIAGVPDVFRSEFPGCEGVSALNQLNTFWERMVRSWCQEQMNVIGHDCERVNAELTGISIAEQSLEEEIGVRFDLEVPMQEECGDRDSVSVSLLRAH